MQQPSEGRRTRAPNTYALSSERSFLCLVVYNLAARYKLDVYLRVLRPFLNRAPSCKCLDASVMHVPLSHVKDCV